MVHESIDKYFAERSLVKIWNSEEEASILKLISDARTHEHRFAQ
jgi:hypothetical protein